MGHFRMIRNQKIRVGLRAMRFSAIERFHDLVNVSIPVFLMAGVIAVAFRFWFWLLAFDAVFACSR